MAADGTGRRRTMRWLCAAALGLAMLVLLLRLGFWQLDRARYKDVLAQRFEAAQSAPAVAPRVLLAMPAGEPWRFRATRAEGELDATHQYLLDNRTHEGRAGYQVLTPLRMDGDAVLVNRGWVPLGADRSVLPEVKLARTHVVVTGRLVPPPQPGLLLGDSGYGAPGWPKVVQAVEPDAMERQLGVHLLPAVFLLDPSQQDCFICEWKPVQGISAARHRGYAVQWFGLAVALVVLLAVTAWKERRRGAG